MLAGTFRPSPPKNKTSKLAAWGIVDTRNKQRVFAAFERLGREEKAPKAVAEMPKPESLTSVRAHLPVSSGN